MNKDKTPTQKNIFMLTYHGRSNYFTGIIGFLDVIGSWPSMISEVFLRKKFGERYFTLSVAIIQLLVMTVLFALYFVDDYRFQSFYIFNWPWILFGIIYFVRSVQHRMEITKYGTAYNLERFSLSDGELASFWDRWRGKKLLGIKVSTYTIYILFEPLIPICIGGLLMLWYYTAALGGLILFSGITLWGRNVYKTITARQSLLDQIDEQICARSVHDIFIEGKPKSETKGVSLPIALPDSLKMRQALCDTVGQITSDPWDDDIV